MPKLRVAVLMGGRSSEREVSLSTGRQVLQALDPGRYDSFSVDTAAIGMAPELAGEREYLAEESVGRDAPCGSGSAPLSPDGFATSLAPARDPLAAGGELTGARRPDVAVICLHGRYGEDGTVQGLLELMEIPYTGSGVLASALAMNKIMSKLVFRAHGIPTPADVALRGRAEADRFLDEFRAGAAPLAPPVIVKPNRQGSTIGVTIVRDPDEMPAALTTALAYDREILVERLIAGTEITASILGSDELQVLPLIEIVPSTGFYDYERKYTPGATEEIVPARIALEQAERARDLARRAHRALGCRGVSRVDMLVDEDDVWVLEVNTIPGMTPTSLLPRAAAAAGIPFPRLLDRMIELALESGVERALSTEA
jgi:D-alanine-D-alanine ligase